MSSKSTYRTDVACLIQNMRVKICGKKKVTEIIQIQIIIMRIEITQI